VKGGFQSRVRFWPGIADVFDSAQAGRDQVIDLMVFGMGASDSIFLKDVFTQRNRHIGDHCSCGAEQTSLIVTWGLRRGLDCDWGSLPHQTGQDQPSALWFEG